MTFPLVLGNRYIDSLIKRESDPINQARIKMLVFIILAYIFFAFILIIAYSIQEQTLQLVRVSIVMLSCLICLVIFKYANAWRLISHVLVVLLTLVVWSNLSLYVRGINIATLQYVWFACALGFFMLGMRWGWFYSAINILPLLVYTALDGNYYFLGTEPHKLERITYMFVLFYDFAVILFLHYFFFKAYQNNFVRLTDAKNELKDVNIKLNDALSHLEKLSNDRMNFLSTMSHELRTPMNGVIGISNALLFQNPREDQKENLAVLKFSAENLLHLINEILDFNKLDAGKAELENVAFDMVTLIKNNIAGLEHSAMDKQIGFHYSIDEKLYGKVIISDPTRLTQVLSNLLNNALKFTKEGRVSLRVGVLAVTPGTISVRFEVEDTGVGIEAERQMDIFEAFVQASTSINRNYGGTGLGLPIVKRLLEIFNSEVKLQSEINVGTKVSFDIDFQYEQELAELPVEVMRKGSDISHLRVLVAEDNLVNIIVIRKTMERWGIVPAIAKNGLEVLNLLETNYFDVILMDLNMPEMDGYKTAAAVRNLVPAKSAVPIIAFTATAQSDLLHRITSVGMNDFILKPFRPEDLFIKLEKIATKETHAAVNPRPPASV